ncbi:MULTISPECIES: DUF2850 domain-containing protein [unclassified Vibrio]|jgi:hypothetical protein|uniref:DUF2850 domain-containing protein n=1 Tax=Vibrio TaxID=662 RepID=UPI002075912B|nr:MULTISPECIES: DUF2850 domain-containing protein [unclassified Vibrio]CAH1562904.1 N-acetylglutamate synthase [Vibrio rotiferianus]MDK9779487.1 DUF2850 domain-containing protein [Vibrio sp. D401a]MDK9801639.1 DUF2850 domain-containing protein [Vibrio sp. D406a]USD49379.1 DUF2850 domain-containing protein [Vibrio sp. SCSIO 43153]CAH1565054.1 N-acetylglutamate synthase [Vibrio rotiferianus]
MSSLAKKNAAINEQPTQKKTNTRKWIERALMFIALVGTLAVIGVYGDLIGRFVYKPVPKSLIYGKWIEQEVAPYAREEFIVSERGIIVQGSTIATDFEFDGKTFSYKVGSKVREFEFVGQNHTEMKLDSNAHYLPVFRLEGKSDLSLR